MDSCCKPKPEAKTKKFKIILWIALVLNFAMFLIEFTSSFLANSQSLKADSLDFLGDAGNYMISLFVLGMSLKVRANASIIKAITMGTLGLWVVFEVIRTPFVGASPNFYFMTKLGLIALLVNTLVAFLLYQFREGDSNMKSVWLCSRNDAIGNIAVIIAGFFVHYFNSYWPDLIVASLMAYLSLSATIKIIKAAKLELK